MNRGENSDKVLQGMGFEGKILKVRTKVKFRSDPAMPKQNPSHPFRRVNHSNIPPRVITLVRPFHSEGILAQNLDLEALVEVG